MMSSARSPAFAGPGGLSCITANTATPPPSLRKAPVLSRVLGSPTHAAAAAAAADSSCVSSLSFSFSAERTTGATSLHSSPHRLPSVAPPKPVRSISAPASGRSAPAGAPPAPLGPMLSSLPITEFPRRSLVSRLGDARLRAGLPMLTGTVTLAPQQSTPPPKPSKPAPASRKRPRRPAKMEELPPPPGMGGVGGVMALGHGGFGAAGRFAHMPMETAEDEDEKEILAYLMSADGMDALGVGLSDDEPMSPPHQRPTMMPPSSSLSLSLACAPPAPHLSTPLGPGRGAVVLGGPLPMDTLGLVCSAGPPPYPPAAAAAAELPAASPKLAEAPRRFTTSPFDRIKVRSQETPGTFSLREINERINSPALRSSVPPLTAATPQCAFRPIEPASAELVAPAVTVLVPPDSAEAEDDACELSEDEGSMGGDVDDDEPLSGSAMEILLSALGPMGAEEPSPAPRNKPGHAAGALGFNGHGNGLSLNFNSGALNNPAAAAMAGLHHHHRHHHHHHPGAGSGVTLMDTTGCGLGPVEQLRSFSPTYLFSGDAQESAMTN